MPLCSIRSCVLLLFVFLYATDSGAQEFEYESTLKNKKRETSSLPPFHFSIYSHIGSLKHLNFGLGLKAGLQMGPLCIGGGISGSSFVHTIKSPSDEHMLEMGSIPLYGFAELLLYKPSPTSVGFYIYGNSGRNNRIGNQDNLPDRDFKAPYNEFGIGFIKKDGLALRTHYRVEIGRQSMSFKGIATASYNAKIDYELHFTSYLLRIAVAL